MRARRPEVPGRASVRRRFARRLLGAIADARMLGVRSGWDHRFTGVRVVVARGRVFVRSWNDEPDGWRRAFQQEPRGAVRVLARPIAVRARQVRSEGLLKAVDEAYRETYSRAADLKWVCGLCLASRRRTTVELLRR